MPSSDWPRGGAPSVQIDGSHGEGGGQIVRTALSLSVMTGRATKITDIRAGRPNPGLAAQHLTAVQALATLCVAEVHGASLNSTELVFTPQAPVRAGSYRFDVAAARPGGSAGAVTLVLQALMPPLALASGRSRVVLRGGTHMAWSPPFDYLCDVWQPAVRRMGIAADCALTVSGWFPIGQGEVSATIEGHSRTGVRPFAPLGLVDRGRLRRVFGRALAANLPAHIPQRMVAQAQTSLAHLQVRLDLAAVEIHAACAGAGLFLTAEYDALRCGFNALGERGKPAERVAEEACAALMDHHASGAALDAHLADQILVPMAFAAGESRFTVERVTQHLETNAWVIERFDVAHIEIARQPTGTALVTVAPA